MFYRLEGCDMIKVLYDYSQVSDLDLIILHQEGEGLFDFEKDEADLIAMFYDILGYGLISTFVYIDGPRCRIKIGNRSVDRDIYSRYKDLSWDKIYDVRLGMAYGIQAVMTDTKKWVYTEPITSKKGGNIKVSNFCVELMDDAFTDFNYGINIILDDKVKFKARSVFRALTHNKIDCSAVNRRDRLMSIWHVCDVLEKKGELENLVGVKRYHDFSCKGIR